MRPSARLGAGAALLLAAALFVALRLEVTTDLAHFLPEGADRRLAQVSRAVADSELTRTVVLSVGAADPDAARAAAAGLAERLGASPRVAWIRAGAGEGLEEAVREIYLPRRFAMLSSDPERELPSRLSDEGLAEAASRLRRELALPTAPLHRAVAAEDPFGAFPAIVERLSGAREGSLRLVDGSLVTEDGSRAIVFLGTRAAAFDSDAQAAVLEDIARALDEVRAAAPVAVELDVSGAGRFAVHARRAIEADIARIALLSALGVLVLFLVLLRSPRALVLLVLPLAAGVVVAAAVGLALFGRLHGLTLAFGATLIGVCIDYPVHLLNHHAMAPSRDGPEGTARRIWPALLIGALTTVAGLAGLAWTSLPGIREIAVFASTGVLAALATTRFLLPALLPAASRPSRLQARAGEALGRLVAAMGRRRRLLLLLPAGAAAFAALSLPALRWVDDVSALNELDAELAAEDERVRSRISQMDRARFVLALGRDEEEALGRNDRVHAALLDAVRAGEVGSFRSLHELLPSADLQRRNLAALARAPRLFERTVAALESEGFVGSAFAPFGAALAAEPPTPLRFADLAGSPLRDLVRPYRIEVGEQVAFLTFLRAVRRPVELAERVDRLEGVLYFDQMDFLADVYRSARSRTLELMVVGLLAVLAVVFARYRRAGPALAAFLPALLAAAVALGVVAAAGIEANLIHLLGLLLVLSIGVDYGVFMVESRTRPEELRATALSLVVACLTTVLAFGLLAMSSNPALRAMGLTTGVGVLLSLVLAPAALVLLAPAPRGP